MVDLEKNIGNGGDPNSSPYHLHHDNETDETALRKIRTAGSLSISPELFEKIYLSPKNRVANDVRATFGNPTPIGLIGFLLSLSPLSNVLLGWRGSGGQGIAEVYVSVVTILLISSISWLRLGIYQRWAHFSFVALLQDPNPSFPRYAKAYIETPALTFPLYSGVYYFFGGLLMILGGILEFLLGNTFPFVVFSTFGAFWLSFATTLTPTYTAISSYPNPDSADVPPQFASTFAFLHVYMGLLCIIYLICALRTNCVFVGIFLALVLTFACLAGSFFYVGDGNAQAGLALQHAGGGCAFVACAFGW
ncbi:MAG: hypothetical protein Q9227_003647 [Pyrenula ochraceoflavens]